MYFNWIWEKFTWLASIHRPLAREEVKAWFHWFWLHCILAAGLPLERIAAARDCACDSTRRAAARFRSIPEAADWRNRVRLLRAIRAAQEVAHRNGMENPESSTLLKMYVWSRVEDRTALRLQRTAHHYLISVSTCWPWDICFTYFCLSRTWTFSKKKKVYLLYIFWNKGNGRSHAQRAALCSSFPPCLP